jgi:hypothetical protein
MTAIHPGAGTRFEWRQPKALERYHELTVDGEITGTLRFAKCAGTLAVAEYGGRRWTFKRSGFWSPRVSVREEGSAVDSAVFTPKWKGGGEIVFQSGRRFILKSISFWGGEWSFENESGAEVISAHGPHGLAHSQGEVSVGLGAATLPETPVLLLVIWYLRLLMLDDASAATMAASVAACG